jgi:hypothetical protein
VVVVVEVCFLFILRLMFMFIGGTFPQKTSRGGHAGLGSGGGGGAARWGGASTQQLHYCEVCKISCAGPQVCVY